MDTPRAILDLDAGNARVRFSVRWFGLIQVRGTFPAVRGRLEVPGHGGQPDVWVEVDSQSVRTGIPLRDRHLRGMRFLDSGKHPVIRFESDHASRHNGVWDVRGRLLLRGMERKVSLSVLDEELSATERRISARFSVPRHPHAIGTAGGIRRLNPLLWAIGREVTVEVQLVVPAAMLAPEHVPAR